MYELKIYRGVSYAMKMKNDAKFGEESTSCFTVDMRIVDLRNYIMFELKKYRAVMFNNTED